MKCVAEIYARLENKSRYCETPRERFDKLAAFVVTLQIELNFKNGLCPSLVVLTANTDPPITVTAP